MTLDEVIEYEKESLQHCKRMLEEIYEDNLENKILKFEVKYHEQLADWLEELAMLRLDSCMIHMPERLHLVENGYNKALNDFAEKLIAKCDRTIKEKWNSNIAPISWAEAYADFKDDIADIAEQLKAGVTND